MNYVYIYICVCVYCSVGPGLAAAPIANRQPDSHPWPPSQYTQNWRPCSNLGGLFMFASSIPQYVVIDNESTDTLTWANNVNTQASNKFVPKPLNFMY